MYSKNEVRYFPRFKLKQKVYRLYQGDVFAREGLKRALFPRAPVRDEMQQKKLQMLPETDDHHVLRVRHKTQSLFVFIKS